MRKMTFTGFPNRPAVIPIPSLFFTALVPHITDIAELKVVLHIFWLLSSQRGIRFVTYNRLRTDPVLMNSIVGDTGEYPEDVLKRALDLAVRDGAVLHLRFDSNNKSEDAYFINAESERRKIDKIRQGEIVLPDLIPQAEVTPAAVIPSDIFKLYEQNIGMLTPLIAEELQEAEKLYPADWIESAFKEAVALNKRSWKYISRILERWAIEGKSDGKSGRDLKKERISEKYISGKYGHMVER